MYLNLLSESTVNVIDDDLFEELLNLINSLLENGNPKV